jgi:hypothetical protein
MAYDGFLTGSGLSKVRVFSDFSVRTWPVLGPSASDPNPKSTTDRYQVVQSNDGAIGIPRGVKERTFTAALVP